jgi:hypothetical protein
MIEPPVQEDRTVVLMPFSNRDEGHVIDRKDGVRRLIRTSLGA